MLIAGAGNLGLHTLDQLLADRYAGEIVFFDEKGELPALITGKYRVISDTESLRAYFKKSGPACVATIGQGRIREKLLQKLLAAGGEARPLISGKAVFVSAFCTFGPGTIVQPGCAISHNVTLGQSVVIHAASLIGHDVVMEDFVTIGSNVNILKGVSIGRYATIGPNVLVYQNVKIGSHAYIAPGVIVTRDVADHQTLSL